MSPVKESSADDSESRDIKINGKTIVNEHSFDNSFESDLADSQSSDSENRNGYSPDTADDNQSREHQVQHRPYPLRNRRARQIPDVIPWSAIHI